MLSKDEVKNIALLARIGIKEEEIEKYQKDLSSILDFFRDLEKLSTDTVDPIGHITGMQDVARTDTSEDFDGARKTLLKENFPDSKEGFLKVRSVF